MAETLWYTIAIQEAEPETPQNGWFWLNPISGQLFQFINDQWLSVISGNTLSVYSVGFFWKSVATQTSAPTIEVGKFWINSTSKTLFVYTDQWLSIISG